MGFEDYVSENEAVAIAGVSPITLNRFAEAGYLRIESDNDGLRLFSKRELLEVFGIQEQIIDNTVAKLEREVFDIPEEPAEAVSTVQIEEPVELKFEETDPQDTQTDLQAGEDHNQIENLVHFPSEEERFATNRQVRAKTKAVALDALEQELTRLKNIVKMQDRVIDLRESEIAGLKEERNWLRTRIERLEEKGDRDQLLLLSETQILRQMIVHQHQKSSPLRSALEWIGLVNPRQAPVLPGPTIDIARK